MNQFEEHLLCESLSKNVVRQDFLVLKLGDVSVTLFFNYLACGRLRPDSCQLLNIVKAG